MDMSALTAATLNHAETPSLWLVDENLEQACLLAVRPRPNLHCLTNRFDISQTLVQQGHQVFLNDFDFSELPGPDYELVVYRVSKEKALVHHCLNMSFRNLAPEGRLVLLGEKQDGIKTYAKTLSRLFGKAGELKKEGRNYRVTATRNSQKTEPETWLDDSRYHELREVQAGGMTFHSKPGIFGWQKIDRGSALLAELAVQKYQNRHLESLLDLGCGYGYLLLATRSLQVDTRLATDNNASAIIAATENFRSSELAVTTSLDDCGSSISMRCQLVLCNPPFHQGFATSQQLSDRFLQNLQRLCEHDGEVLMVVNQFIPVERLAASRFHDCQALLSQDGFTVFSLRNPVSTRNNNP